MSMMLYCVGKGGLIQHQSVASLMNTIEGERGFEELRRYIKQGNVFCSDIALVIQERSDLENTYSKSLSKISTRLTKAAGSCIGTLAEAWGLVAVEMEAEAELHRQLAQHLNDDLAKPIKSLADTQHKTRKPIEMSVEKSYKLYCDGRSDEVKCKRKAGDVTRERERLCNQNTTKTDSKGKPLGEKDLQKLDKLVKKAEDNLRKVDKDYHNVCRRAESERQEWEVAIFKANTALQNIEEERISQMQEFLNKYNSHLSVIGPKLVKSSDKLAETVMSIDTHSDLRKVIDNKGTGANQPEQVLPDYFAEDFGNHMDRERRRQLLQNYLIQLQQDLERETKAKEGVEKLVEVYQNKPQYADAETLEDTRHKLTSVHSTLNYCEAAYYKLSCSMAELEGKPKPTHRVQTYIERTRDKQGFMTSLLKLPSSMVERHGSTEPTTHVPGRGHPDGVPDSPFGSRHGSEPTYLKLARGGDGDNMSLASTVSYHTIPADKLGRAGGSVRAPPLGPGGPVKRHSTGKHRAAPSAPPAARSISRYYSVREGSTEYDEDDDEFETYDHTNSEAIGHCRAIYEYVGQQFDELSIQPGDVITIYDKQVDGWWQGEVHGRTGIFPGSYVEEINGAQGFTNL